MGVRYVVLIIKEGQNSEKSLRGFESNSKRVQHRCKEHCADIWRRPGAKHCSSLCSQSEGSEYCGGQARVENPIKSCPKALVMFATCSWPSLCEQSELQCWRRNRRLCGPVQISAARALPLTFDNSILNTLPLVASFCKSKEVGRAQTASIARWSFAAVAFSIHPPPCAKNGLQK